MAPSVGAGHPRSGSPDGLQQVHLLLDAGLDPPVGAIVAQVAHRVLELLHQRIEVRILTGQHAQIAHQAREHAGQRRAQGAGAAQVVAQAELVDEAREQVEVTIGELVAGQFVERGVSRFEERHESALASEFIRARLLERLAALHGVVDDVRQGLDRRLALQRRGQRAVQLAEDVLGDAFMVDQRQPDLAPGLGPHADELAAHGYSSPRKARCWRAGEERVEFSQRCAGGRSSALSTRNATFGEVVAASPAAAASERSSRSRSLLTDALHATS